MAIDQPLVVYDRDDSDGDKVPNKAKMNKVAERWASERAGRKSLVGKEISLSELLSNDKQDKQNG